MQRQKSSAPDEASKDTAAQLAFADLSDLKEEAQKLGPHQKNQISPVKLKDASMPWPKKTKTSSDSSQTKGKAPAAA